LIGFQEGAEETFSFGNLTLSFFPAFVGLSENEDVFVAVVAVEGFADVFEGSLTAWVAEHGEFEWITPTVDDGFGDTASAEAIDVADDVVKLDVHFVVGFLHVLDLACAGANKIVALPVEVAHASDVFVRDEGGVEETCGVELLQPLSVLDVGLAAGDAFDVAGIDEADLDVGFLKKVVERDPVVAGAFHGDGLNAGFKEPGDGISEIGVEGAEGADGVGVATFRDSDDDFFSGDVDTSGIGMTDLLKEGALLLAFG